MGMLMTAIGEVREHPPELPFPKVYQAYTAPINDCVNNEERVTQEGVCARNRNDQWLAGYLSGIGISTSSIDQF